LLLGGVIDRLIVTDHRLEPVNRQGRRAEAWAGPHLTRLWQNLSLRWDRGQDKVPALFAPLCGWHCSSKPTAALIDTAL